MGENRIDVFIRGKDNAVLHNWWSSNRWFDWQSLGGVSTSTPVVSSWGADKFVVFVKGTENVSRYSWWNSIIWSKWEQVQ